MVNTSLGFHTFAVYRRLSLEEYSSITGDFARCVGDGGMKKRPITNKENRVIGEEYTYTYNKGIRWLIVSNDTNPTFSLYGVKAIINPKVLIGEEKSYITATKEIDLNKVKALFNAETRRISDSLGTIDSFSMSRCDYCVNFDLKEMEIPCSVEQMFALIKRANIPAHYTERTEYDEVSRRQKANKDSLYLESNSTVINCYMKQRQLMRVYQSCPDMDDSDSLIRFEVQCKYAKIYSMSKSELCKSKTPEPAVEVEKDYYELMDDLLYGPRIPVNALLTDYVSADVIRKYFNKVIRKGNYYQLETAKRMITSKGFYSKKEDRLINTLDLINRKRGISKAKEGLESKQREDFKRTVRELEEIGINPVTIPREWGIKRIPNLLDAYYDKVLKEQFKQEKMEEYFNEIKRKRNRRSNSVYKANPADFRRDNLISP